LRISGPQNSVIAEQIGLQENQVAVQREQLRVLQKEQGRLQKLVAAQAAPAKQLDDVDGQIAILEKQIASAATQIKVLKQQMQAQEQTAALVNRGILGEKQPLEVRKAQLDDQLRRCKVVNPLKGTVLTKYAEQYEMAAPGKALYKIANLEKMTLRAYITGDQLPQVKIGQQVQIAVAQGTEPSKNYTGTITWIADQAEFTPKSIQTKNERANLVYAVKVETPNDGYLKIGMYGDVTF
jgi:HlyD family secretion protein